MVQIGSLLLKETESGQEKGVALLNSSSPWASDLQDLTKLFDSPSTSAVTTRTAVVSSEDIERLRREAKSAAFKSVYEQDANVHSHAFVRDHLKTLEGGRLTIARGSINSYGFSPHPLSSYLDWLSQLFSSSERKPVIISITGPPEAVGGTIAYLRDWTSEILGGTADEGWSNLIGVEVNLSCPNVKGTDMPTAYDPEAIAQYLKEIKAANEGSRGHLLSVGLKLPPYSYHAQFAALVQELSSLGSLKDAGRHPIAFLTSTNTLGCSFWLNEGDSPGRFTPSLPRGLPGDDQGFDGTGGLAGESLHPISLGNVYRLRRLLDASGDKRLKNIDIIGVGGVISGLAAQRMHAAGAKAVALATALGREGVDCFDRISDEIL
ncbi:FMN-linked oxidoreductase [Acaromyces ingoldii]|uniref:Dihydroorotate oxidase n=1 Tax=Acaromyces ingoldii TaxID=215250 RepID=A0A316YTA7_9BASI|nr:FMN-linked oxidoreductase [Acaromyces ingoldii]PWN92014.1 FMN-linked oxidoreductase [Acaromyces ingoldii]